MTTATREKRRTKKRFREPDVLIDDDDAVRQRCYYDLKFFYREILLYGNESYQRALGKLHDFFFDFLRLEELAFMPEDCRHSPIAKYLPQRGPDGKYPERWIFWPTLNSEPEVLDGRNHYLERELHGGALFHPGGPGEEGQAPKKNRCGMLLRIVGDGRIKSLMAPRGHLKSQIGHVAYILQEVIRDPSVRIMSRSAQASLAESFLGQVRSILARNEAFSRYFPYLIPQGREFVNNKTELQVRTNIRRGKESTIESAGVDSDVTGNHGDVTVFDDVVSLKNLEQQEKVRTKVSEVAFISDVNFRLVNLGTIYRENDNHSMFIRPAREGQGSAYDRTSFMICSMEDANGELMWKEYQTWDEMHLKRAFVSDDAFWYSQMYNNPWIGRGSGFKIEWIREYEDLPEACAHDKKLNIIITFDTANKAHKKSDFTAGMVHGQDPQTKQIYFLEGFRERIPQEQMPVRMVTLSRKWQLIAMKYNGNFRVGVEEINFIENLRSACKREMERQNCHIHFGLLNPKNRRKEDRISKMKYFYKWGLWLWPSSANGGEWLADFRNSWLKWPKGSYDDDLDCAAYCLDLAEPFQIGAPAAPALPALPSGAYDRTREEDPEDKPVGGRGRVAAGSKNYDRFQDIAARAKGGRGRWRPGDPK